MSNKISNLLLNANVTLSQFDSHDLIETFPDILECLGDNYIKCVIQYTLPFDMHISSIMLKLPKLTGTRISFYLTTITGNIVEDFGFTEEAGVTSIDDDDYQYIDITTFLLNSSTNNVTFVIKPTNSLSYFTCYNNPQIIVNGIKNEYHIFNNSKISTNIGLTSGITYDPIFRTFKTTTNLISCEGGDMPLNLNIVYNHYHLYNGHAINDNFKFNYEQYIYSDESNYIYVDGDYNIHTFKPTNQSDTYYDIFQPGLLLIIENNSYRITDEHLRNLYFNSSGQLVKISIKKSDTVYSECIIEYSNNKINRITDDLGRTCSITYYGATPSSPRMIVIKKLGIIDKTIYFDEEDEISYIAGIIFNGTPNNLLYFTYETIGNKKYLKSIKEINKEVLEFTYKDNIMLQELKHYVENGNIQNLISRYDIYSRGNRAEIKNYSPSNSFIATNIIEVDDEGNVIKTFDLIDGQPTNERLYSIELYTKTTSSKWFDKIYIEPENTSDDIEDTINCINQSDLFYDVDSISNFCTINDSNFKKYKVMFAFKANQIFSIHDVAYNVLFQVLIEEDGIQEPVLIEPIKLTEYFDTYIFEFNLPKKENLTIKFGYKFSGIQFQFSSNSFYFGEKYHYGIYDCISAQTNGDTHNTNTGVWYELCSPLYIECNDGNVYIDENVNMTKLDYQLTQNSYFNNRTSNNEHTLWYNNGRDCIINVKNAKFSFINNQSVTLPTITLATINEYCNRTEVQIYEMTPDGMSVHNDYTYTDNDNVSNNSFTTQTYDKYDRPIFEMDSRGKNTIYEYIVSNDGESVMTRHYSNSSPSQAIVSVNTMINYNVYTEYSSSYTPYPTDESVESYYNSFIINKQIGKVTKETLPNNLDIHYTYKQDAKSIDNISVTVDDIENKNTYSYSSNKIVGLSNNNLLYEFTYGTRNELINVLLGNDNIINKSYLYGTNSTTINNTYNTGYTTLNRFDLQGRLIDISNNGNSHYSAVYSNYALNDENNNDLPINNCTTALLRRTIDSGKTTNYYYDSTDYNLDNPNIDNRQNGYKQLTRIENLDYTMKFGYDYKRRLKTVKTDLVDYNHKLVYSYIDGDKLNDDLFNQIDITFNNINIKKNYMYDSLNRLSNTKYQLGSNIIDKSYTYFSSQQYTSKFIKQIVYSKGLQNNNMSMFDRENISYDELGNIKEIIYASNKKINYTYDKLGRLIQEDNNVLNKSFRYTYNSSGDITKKQVYDLINNNISNLVETTFSYYDDENQTSSHKLLKVNNTSITYGETINSLLPLTYGTKQFTWGLNNKLLSYKKSNTASPIQFTYNTMGNRLTKSQVIDVNVIEEHIYTYDQNRLIKEKITVRPVNLGELTPSYNDLPKYTYIYYLYDESGIIGFIYDDTIYYYVKDILGNIKYILDSTYNIVAKYEYDAWGNHQVYRYISGSYSINTDPAFIGNINPIRYKGYYYDVETQLFYCNSRYYSPELCRFISPDSIEYLDPQSINGLNLYAYCMNNPIMYADPSGHSIILAMLIGAGIGLVVGLGSQLASDVISNVITNGFDFSEWEMSSWQTYVGAGLGGAIGGALTPFLGPVVTGFITGASSTAISMGLSNITGVSNYSLGEIFATSLLIGSVSGITAGILDNVKIPSINSGRGSLTAVSKQINTKLVNGSIKNVSIKTIGKMAALNAIYSAPFTVFNGLFTNGAVISPAY